MAKRKKSKDSVKNHSTFLVIVGIVAVIAVIILIVNFTSDKALVGEGFRAVEDPKIYKTVAALPEPSPTVGEVDDTIMKIFTCPETLIKLDTFKNMPNGFTMYPRYNLEGMLCGTNKVLCSYKSESVSTEDEDYLWEFIENLNVKDCLSVGANSCKCKTI